MSETPQNGDDRNPDAADPLATDGSDHAAQRDPADGATGRRTAASAEDADEDMYHGQPEPGERNGIESEGGVGDSDANGSSDLNGSSASAASGSHETRAAGEPHTPDIARQAYTERAEPGVVTASEPIVAEEPAPVAESAMVQEPRAAAHPAEGESVGHGGGGDRPSHPDSWPLSYVQSGPLYVQAPTPPERKGNRGFGILISLLATVVFALVSCALLAGVIVIQGGTVDVVGGILLRAPFWLPVAMFFVASVAAVVIVNRAGWWAHVIASFLVALLTYGAYLGGSLIDQAMRLSPSQVPDFLGQIWLSIPGIIAFIVAREVSMWFGAWIASRGRRVAARNAEAQREYELVLERGPSL